MGVPRRVADLRHDSRRALARGVGRAPRRVAGHRGFRDDRVHVCLGHARARGFGGGPVIVVVGLNHETAPVAVREALAFPPDRLPEALACVRAQAGLAEAVILSTCNRVEVYGRATEASLDAVAAFLARFHGREPTEIAPYLYRLEGEAAVRHAFRVAASLDS